MSALLSDDAELIYAEAGPVLSDVAARLRDGVLVPYLGAGVTALASNAVPSTPEALAEFLGTKVALPSRARGNAWAAAQFIESTRHRATVTSLMAEAFAVPVAPSFLHCELAAMKLPLIVDSWYDGAMRNALGAGGSGARWGEIQGITRAGIGEDLWYRFYNAAGEQVDAATAEGWETILYKPHGGIVPAQNFLITDADYVEVLTEIDIQTPIPNQVKDRRSQRGFLFLGCRFHDQLLRTYARQVMKRSTSPHYAVFAPGEALTRNEIRFLAAEGIIAVEAELGKAVEEILKAA